MPQSTPNPDRVSVLSIGGQHYFIEGGLTLAELAQVTAIMVRARRMKLEGYGHGQRDVRYLAQDAEHPHIDITFEQLDPRRVDVSAFYPAEEEIEPAVDEAEADVAVNEVS